MTKDEALDFALEVMQINLTLLKKINPYKGQEDLLSDSLDLTHKAITAIKQARSAPEEPVYHLRQFGDVTKEQLDRYMATGDINPQQGGTHDL